MGLEYKRAGIHIKIMQHAVHNQKTRAGIHLKIMQYAVHERYSQATHS